MPDSLHIRVLGNPTIILNGTPVSGIAYNKAIALVYYLAVTGRAHTRETIAGLLWADAPPEQARKNLRDVLMSLRRVIAPYLDITRQTVGLITEAAVFVDSRAFMAHLESASRAASPAAENAALQAAVELYCGDLLEGFFVAQSAEFEEWMLTERERLRQLALHALHTLATNAAHQGEYLEGISYATRLLARDPLREETHRQLMLLLAASGQRSAALSQYETLRHTLYDELGVEPSLETITLYERVATGDIADTSATITLPATERPKHNLPALLTAVIGRAREVTHLVQWLRSPGCRLLSIVGAGGVGKTTLALHAAWHLVELAQTEQLFAHGIFFASLAAIDPATWQAADGTPLLLKDALAIPVASAVGLAFSGADAPHIQLSHYLRRKHSLLVLDNFEHLRGATDFVTELLHHAPDVKILVTSRGRLNVRGEYILELDGLQFPHDYDDQTNWDAYSAIQLFQQSAQAVAPRFVVTEPDKAAIARICKLLYGLPLGIELAASWVRLLPCADVAREIETNLSFLQASQRDIPERHQSLRAVFDHSWNLLTASERHVLRRLSIFRGSFDRTTAAYVCSDAEPQWPLTPITTRDSSPIAINFLSMLAALVDDSLVRRTEALDSDGISVRYTLQETVRQYAAERLAEAQDATHAEQTITSDRHCYYYLHFLYQCQEDLQGSRQQKALAEITTEIENIRSAWRWAIDRGHLQVINAATTSLFLFYDMRSWFREGMEAFALAASRLSDVVKINGGSQRDIVMVWGKVLARQGWFTFHLGQQIEARELLEQSLTILRALDLPRELVFPLNYLAAVTSYLGAYTEAQQLGQEGLMVSQGSGDWYGEITAKNILGQIAYSLGHYEEARCHFQESLDMERQKGNRWSMAFPLINLGTVAYALGDYHEAQRRFQEGLVIREELSDARGTALCLNHLGDTAEALNDYIKARHVYQRGLDLFKEIGNYWGVASSLSRLGYNALATTEFETALSYFRESLRAALIAQAPPRMLDALVGLAMLFSDNEPERAIFLATLVWHHPSATQRSRDRAASVCQKLSAPLFTPFAVTALQQEHTQTLTEVAEQILSTIE